MDVCGDDSSGDTTPSDYAAPDSLRQSFQPSFTVTVTDFTRDGDSFFITIKSVKTGDQLTEYQVKREYEDFEFLNQCLVNDNDINGILVPPLPPRPNVDDIQLESQTGERSSPQFQKQEGKTFEKYLQAVVNHPVLGSGAAVHKFLTVVQAPNRTKVKKGFFGKLFSAVEETRKSNHRDIDEYFQRQRDWSNNYADSMKQLYANLNGVIHSKRKIASAYGHLATSLNMGNSFLLQSKTNQNANSVLVNFSEVLEECKRCCENDATNDENTLGFHLDLAARYADALKEMHYRRTCLLIAYEDANRNLSKAKPHKVEVAEDAKLAAERVFEKCSDLASQEIVSFHRDRVLSFQQALMLHAETNINTAKDSHALLTKLVSTFKQLKV